MVGIQEYEDKLNDNNNQTRLSNLKNIAEQIKNGFITSKSKDTNVNNHIHTFYSFSPYSPAKAVWMAYKEGLQTAGIMDHDTLSGAKEFIEAGKILDMPVTVGVELRADMSDTPLKGRKINNPDQTSIAYVALHGIPHTKIDELNEFFVYYREKRNIRNKNMIKKINEITGKYNITVDYEKDVYPISKADEGGSITERHILFALCRKITDKFGYGKGTLDFLINTLKIKVSDKNIKYLSDSDNPFYLYDLLGALKSDMVRMFYINAKEECPKIKDVVRIAEKTGAVLAYAYLGDVKQSVTGDKNPQEFEDSYIEELFLTLSTLGFNAVTYMPARNTHEQLLKVKELCREYSLFEISGEDINSPRQNFICKALKKDEFSNLIDSTWALIGHELSGTENIDGGLFTQKTIKKYPELDKRITIYSIMAKMMTGREVKC